MVRPILLDVCLFTVPHRILCGIHSRMKCDDETAYLKWRSSFWQESSQRQFSSFAVLSCWTGRACGHRNRYQALVHSHAFFKCRYEAIFPSFRLQYVIIQWVASHLSNGMSHALRLSRWVQEARAKSVRSSRWDCERRIYGIKICKFFNDHP